MVVKTRGDGMEIEIEFLVYETDEEAVERIKAIIEELKSHVVKDSIKYEFEGNFLVIKVKVGVEVDSKTVEDYLTGAFGRENLQVEPT